MNRIQSIFILFIASVSVAAFAARPRHGSKAKTDEDYDFWEPDYSVVTVMSGVVGDTSATVGTFNEICVPREVIAPAPQLPKHPIMGEAVITDPEVICNFVRRNNPAFPQEIAEAYLKVGEMYGIRGDMALCQAIIETGWFRFADGTAVRPEQHNYCGMGVTSRGMTGNSFESIEDGVRAQIQHLYAYCCRRPIPEGESLLDPRFKLVSRGVAPNWEDLSNRWAMNPNYGNQIIRLHQQLVDFDKEK